MSGLKRPYRGSGGQLPASHCYGPGSVPGLTHMTFVVALEQVFLQVLRSFPVSIIPPMFHTHLILHVALTRRGKGETWEPSKSNACLEIVWALDR